MLAPTQSSSFSLAPPPLLHGVPGALLTALVIIAGVTLTWVGWKTTAAAEERSARAALSVHAQDIQTGLQDRLLAYEGLLRAGAGFLEAAWPVSPTQWEAFVAQLSLAAVYPGIQGVGFSAAVQTGQELTYWREALEPLGLKERIPSARGELPETAIVLLEPRDERNLRAIGFDMMSETVRRTAMERARDEAGPALSGRVTLVQEIDRKNAQPGFLLYLPIYSANRTPIDVDERRRTLRGFVYSPFRAGDFFSSAVDVDEGAVMFEVFDGAEASGRPLYRSAAAPAVGRLFEVRRLRSAGHDWTLRVWSGDSADGVPHAARIIAASGGAITLLLAAIVSMLALSRQTLHERAAHDRAFAQRERELNERLEQRVVERTSQLESANRELLAANRDLEAFAYTVSHDLRTPLRAVNGHIERFLATADSVNEAQQHHAASIRRNVSRMAQMIEDLLNFAIVSRRPLEKKPVSMPKLLQPAIEQLCSGQPIEIEVRDEELGVVNADPMLLQQALTNLLSNAVKFSRRAQPPRIWVGAEVHDGKRVFYVRDNGVGFDMQYADKLFGVFERLHRSTEFEGLGVGLAIVKQIIERHGGRVWAHAEPDRGATFYFTLGE